MVLARKEPAGYPELSFLEFDVLELLADIQVEMGLTSAEPATLSLQSIETLACIYHGPGKAGGNIYLHSLFNRSDVPQPVIEHVLRHELLHLKIPARVIDGKRIDHPPEFWEAEAKLVPWKSASWAWMYTAFWDALKVDRDDECIWIKKNWKRLQRHPYPSWQAILDDTKLFEEKEEEIKGLMQGI